MSDIHATTQIATSEGSTTVAMISAHTLSLGTIFGSFMGYLPDFAAGAAFIWYMIVIWESKTVVALRSKLRAKDAETEKPTPDATL